MVAFLPCPSKRGGVRGGICKKLKKAEEAVEFQLFGGANLHGDVMKLGDRLTSCNHTCIFLQIDRLIGCNCIFLVYFHLYLYLCWCILLSEMNTVAIG